MNILGSRKKSGYSLNISSLLGINQIKNSIEIQKKLFLSHYRRF